MYHFQNSCLKTCCNKRGSAIHDTRPIDSRANDAHDSCINYADMLTLYRDNSWYQSKLKYKRDTQIPGLLGEEKKLDQRSCFLKKLSLSFKISSDENNIAKLVVNVWEDYSNKFCQLFFNSAQINMIFESSHQSQMF